MTDFTGLLTRYPRAVLDERERVRAEGGLRERIRFDLVARPQHACGLLAAADVASFSGVDRFVAVEFGVAEGSGLRNLADVAALVTSETGVGISIVGFDSGRGLPPPRDHRDHPEIWTEGDFAMADAEGIAGTLPADARIVLGQVGETLPEFVSSFGPDPVGFVSFDLDYHSSTVDALALYDLPADRLLPVTVTCFDDVIGAPTRIGSIFRTAAAGQLLAIDEFNASRDRRRLDALSVLRHRRPLDREPWLDKMYALHVLDHPIRQPHSRDPASMGDHGRDERFDWPL